MSIGEVVLPKEDARFCSGKLYDHVDALQAMTAERDELSKLLHQALDERDHYIKDRDALKADAARYVAKRKEIFLKSMRMQVSGPRPTEEEFNADYDARCDKAIDGYVADHRGVLVFNAAMKGKS